MMEDDKWKTEYSSKNNGVSPPSFLLRFRDADVTRNSNFSGKGISKNNSTCENAVARKEGSCTLRVMGSCQGLDH